MVKMVSNFNLNTNSDGEKQVQFTINPVRIPLREIFKFKVLIVTANPDMEGMSSIDVDKHVSMVEDALKRSRFSNRFKSIVVRDVQYRELRRKLLDEDPHVVHFLGHGADKEGLVFNDEFVSTEALAGLFANLPGRIWCVLLNACYSETQAEAIYKSIDCVIGMRNQIGEIDSADFSEGFYDALGAGKPFDRAFAIGRSAIARLGRDDSENLKLFYRPSAVSLSIRTPREKRRLRRTRWRSN